MTKSLLGIGDEMVHSQTGNHPEGGSMTIKAHDLPVVAERAESLFLPLWLRRSTTGAEVDVDLYLLLKVRTELLVAQDSPLLWVNILPRTLKKCGR